MNKKGKKVIRKLGIALVVFVVLAFLLVACGTSEPQELIEEPTTEEEQPDEAVSEQPTKEESEQPKEKVVIDFWDLSEAEEFRTWMANYAAEFEEENPGVEVNFTWVDTGSWDEKMLTAMSAGEEPDIWFSNSGESLNKFIRAERVAPLDGLIDESLYLEGRIESSKFNGNLYSIPRSGKVIGLWYNVNLFENLGLEPPSNWEALNEVAESLKSEGVIPFALGNNVKWALGMYYDYLVYNYCGPEAREKATFERDGFSWEDQCFVDAAERIVEFVENDYFPPGFNGMSPDDANSLFFTDQAGFDASGSWLVGIAKGAAPEGFQLKLLPWPSPPDALYPTNNGEAWVAGTDVWAVSASSENVEICAKFLNGIGERGDSFAAAIGSLPITPGYTPEDPDLAKIAEQASNAKYVMPSGDRAVPASMAEYWKDNLQLLSAGELTPEEFAQAMADAVQKEKDSFE